MMATFVSKPPFGMRLFGAVVLSTSLIHSSDKGERLYANNLYDCCVSCDQPSVRFITRRTLFTKRY